MICSTPDHFNWYSYHACTTGVEVNDQTVKSLYTMTIKLKRLCVYIIQSFGSLKAQESEGVTV